MAVSEPVFPARRRQTDGARPFDSLSAAQLTKLLNDFVIDFNVTEAASPQSTNILTRTNSMEESNSR